MQLSPTNSQLATSLACTPRTIRNLRSRGIDPSNTLQVSLYLNAISRPSPKMVRANLDALVDLENKLLVAGLDQALVRNIPSITS